MSDVIPKNQANRLPFTISIATTEAEIREVCAHRSRMYSKEMPELGARLIEPEDRDRQAPGREVIVARSRLDREIIGSIRVHLNNEAPLPIESCVELPQALRGKLLMESTRLCSSGGIVCRSALCKAAIIYAQSQGASHCAIASRERLVKIYEAMGFKDLFEPGATVPIPYANNVQHRILGLPLEQGAYVEATRAAMDPSLFQFYHGEHVDTFDFSKAMRLGERRAAAH